MPKRVLDFDALWASDKISALPGWAQAEYAWLYGLADASGSFELTNLRVIWGRVAAIRKDLTIERLDEVFQTFIAGGLLFTWEASGKRYGHWTGSDVPGRLPPPSWRARLERLAPPVPKQELAAYMSRFSSRREPGLTEEAAPQPPAATQQPQIVAELNRTEQVATSTPKTSDGIEADPAQLKFCLERAQAQEWDRDWNKEEGIPDTPARVSLPLSLEPASQSCSDESAATGAAAIRAEELLRIYDQERGNLSPVAGMTPERKRHCTQRIRAGLSRETFAAAVRRAAATPFLAGEGARGWRASFDWLIANDTNVRKVLEGAYDAVETRASAHGGSAARQRPIDRALYSELHVGTGPVAAECGARVRPEVLERIRAREAARGSP
jgi:hypothetical protein